MKTVLYNAGCWEEEHARLITGQPVTLSVNNVFWLISMCTPVDLEGLGVGFLYNENIIQSLEDIASVRVYPGGDNIDIWLNCPVRKPEKWIRTSGCSGGSTSVEDSGFRSRLTKPQNGVMLPPEMIG